jgi:hypothetical protein
MHSYKIKLFVCNIFSHEKIAFHVKLFFLEKLPISDKEEQFANGFNPQDCSPTFSVTVDHLGILRYPELLSTDCVRTKIGYNHGLHVWEIKWPCKTRGSHPVIGVATKHAPLKGVGYENLVGRNRHSWGWNLETLSLHHDGIRVSEYPQEKFYSTCKMNIKSYDNILLILDLINFTVSFLIKDETFNPPNYYNLGVAFQLKQNDKLYYPIIQSVYGESFIEIKYLGGYSTISPTLQSLCKLAVIEHLTLKHISCTPSKFQKYIMNHE